MTSKRIALILVALSVASIIALSSPSSRNEAASSSVKEAKLEPEMARGAVTSSRPLRRSKTSSAFAANKNHRDQEMSAWQSCELV